MIFSEITYDFRVVLVEFFLVEKWEVATNAQCFLPGLNEILPPHSNGPFHEDRIIDLQVINPSDLFFELGVLVIGCPPSDVVERSILVSFASPVVLIFLLPNLNK